MTATLSVKEGATTVPLTIRDLRVRAVDVPLVHPIQTARGTIGTSPLVLIDLLTQEGVTGSTYLFCYTPLVLVPLARLVSNLADLLRGTAASPEATAQVIETHFYLLGSSGLIAMASAGIDMAIWDVIARAERVPLNRLLGGDGGTVPAYAAVRSMKPEAAAREAAQAVEAGFGAVKVKLGHDTLEEDLAVVRMVRLAVGDTVQVMADYNQSLTVHEAMRRGRVLDGEGLAWIEEPVPADDDAGHARIALALHTPIQLGENWWGARDLARSVAARAADCATFDVVRVGGVTGWLQAAPIAQKAGWPVSSHRYPEMSASLLAATPMSHWLEYVDTVSPVLSQALRIERGRAIVSSEPGAGLTWDERAVDRFLVG